MINSSNAFIKTQIASISDINLVTTAATFILVAFVAHHIFAIIRNIYFHPLSKFPGPKLAAAGSYYEFYFDVIKDGTYLWEIERMHEQYGPVVRVNARELHIRDPEYYSTVYAGQGRRVNKDAEATAAFTVPSATLATVEHDLHRLRRSILAPFFSKRMVNRTEPIINERVERLCHQLDVARETGKTINLDAAYAALTADIITTYFYGHNHDYLDRPGFRFALRDAILGLIGFYHVTRFLPTVAAFIKTLPIPVVRLIQPGAADLLLHQKDIESKLARGEHDGPDAPSAVVVNALKDDKIPASERSIQRLVDEGTTVIFAGTETTARALSVMTFHLYNNTSCLARLRQELAPVFAAYRGQAPPSTALETLPYLCGIVSEGLRLSHGPVVRLPRVAPDTALTYRGRIIPPNTPVSLSTYLMHMDSSVFPEPKKFRPERWINEHGKRDTILERFICSFTKGTRQCLGINMAYAEMYLAVSRIVMTYDIALVDTTEADLEVHHIRLTGYPAKGLGEVKVRVEQRS